MSLLTKRRTREPVIADLSINHIEKQILRAGYTVERVLFDYGYDLTIRTFDPDGHHEPGNIFVQMKASDAPEYNETGEFVTVRVDPRDDAMWRAEFAPVLLIFYDAAKDTAFYLHYQNVPRTTRRSVRIPTANQFDEDVARHLRDVKNASEKDRRT